MKKGIGIDIVAIDRVKTAVKEHGNKFLSKVYTPDEVSYCSNRKALKYPELAARFAAKEAYAKAIGTGMRGIRWKDIEVLNEKSGKPYICVKGRRNKSALVSLSHDYQNAIACVVVM